MGFRLPQDFRGASGGPLFFGETPLRARPTPALALAFAAAACAGPADTSVDDAWVRLPAVPGRPAAAYFTVHGGPRASTLIKVRADYAIRSEMHRSMMANGVAGMAPLTSVPIPAGADVPFQPGGRHVMLYGMDPRAVPGTTTLLTLTFGDGGRLYRKAYVVGAGDPKPE